MAPRHNGFTVWHQQNAWTIYIRSIKKSIDIELSPDGFSHTYVDPQKGVIRCTGRVTQSHLDRWWHEAHGKDSDESVALQLAFLSWFIDRWIYEDEYPYMDDNASYVGFEGKPNYYMRGHTAAGSHRIRRYVPGMAASVGVALILGVLTCLWVDRRRLMSKGAS